MSTVTPLVVRAGMLTVRAALSTIFAALAVAAVLVGSLAAPTPPANAADDSCPSVEVVFARGTNEAPGVGATGQAFVDALNARLPGKTVDVYAVNYPASLNFGQAADGIADASTKIEAVAASCPTTKIVLGGYSQGAAVAGYTTTDTVPAGFDLPTGITGPMPARDRPARRSSGLVRNTGCVVSQPGGPQRTTHHHRPAIHRENPSAVCNRRPGLFPRWPRPLRAQLLQGQRNGRPSSRLHRPPARTHLPRRRWCSRRQVRSAPASAPTSRLRHLRPSLTRRWATERHRHHGTGGDATNGRK